MKKIIFTLDVLNKEQKKKHHIHDAFYFIEYVVYITPKSNIESATLIKPAIFAPFA